MKFRFAYENLLKFYKQQEELARRDYMENLNRLDEEKARLQALYKTQDEAIAESYRLRETDDQFSSAKLAQLDSFAVGQEQRIKTQREIVINHTAIVEGKQEILIAAVKERKIFEKLKEKKWQEYRKQQQKIEMKINDEIVVTRFKRSESK